MKLDKNPAAFLDTTFLLPFFQIDINIEAFDLNKYREFITILSEAHLSELSIFEAKAKLFRLSTKDATYKQALEAFGNNLAILREDEKFIFHPYTKHDDTYFNLISAKNLGLDSFDTIILAQALDVGILITEDKEMLNIRNQEAFVKDPLLGKMMIKRWKELSQ